MVKFYIAATVLLLVWVLFIVEPLIWLRRRVDRLFSSRSVQSGRNDHRNMSKRVRQARRW